MVYGDIREIAKTFQFLHGAIKSIVPDPNNPRKDIFQFLHGAIKSGGGAPMRFGIEGFQFLHGAIKSKLGNTKLDQMKAISIPTWCD